MKEGEDEGASALNSAILEIHPAVPRWSVAYSQASQYNSFSIIRRCPGDIFIDTTDSITLLLQYDEQDFGKAVELIDTNYQFVKHGKDYVLDTEAVLKGFWLRVVDDPRFYGSRADGYKPLNPNKLLIIGINEADSKIAYLYHWDHAIDSIEDLDEFIESKYYLE